MRDSKLTNRTIRLVGPLIVMLLIIAAGVAIPQVAGAAPNPPGNNGTIKVDDMPFDDLPNNEPHVGCVFQVDFYGFDQGDLNADVTFEAHPPTGERQVLLTDTVFIGEDDNSGGGSEAGLDASRTYTLDLSGITPHPNQGVHVKLIIHADGSQGADTKYKVFWVTGCESGSTTTTTTTTPGGGGSTTTTTTTAPGGSTPGGGSTTTTVGQPTNSGGGGNQSATSGEAARASGLPGTGTNALPIAVTALLLLAVGVGGLIVSRRMRTR